MHRGLARRTAPHVTGAALTSTGAAALSPSLDRASPPAVPKMRHQFNCELGRRLVERRNEFEHVGGRFRVLSHHLVQRVDDSQLAEFQHVKEELEKG